MTDLLERYGLSTQEKGAPQGPSSTPGKTTGGVDLLERYGVKPQQAAAQPQAKQRTAPAVLPDEIPTLAPRGDEATVAEKLAQRQDPNAVVQAGQMSDAEKYLALGIPSGIARGLTKGVGGIAQLLGGAGEKLGLPVSAAGATEATQSMLQTLPQGGGPAAQGAEFIGQGLPFMVGSGASTAAAVPTIAKEGLIGALSGASQYIEDPEKAGLSGERALGAAVGTGAGVALPAAAALGGAFKRAFSPTSTGRAAAVEELPTEAAIKSAKLGEEGLVVAPAAAAGSERGLSDLGKIRLRKASDRAALERKIQESTGRAQDRVTELFSTFLPEGAPSEARKQVSDLIETALTKQSPKVAEFSQYAENPAVEAALNTISRDPVLRDQFEEFAPDAIGRLDMIRRDLDRQKMAALRGDSEAAQRLASIQDAQAVIRNIANEASPEYARALAISHREQIIRSMADRMGLSTKLSDDILKADVDEFYKKFLKNERSYNQLRSDLEAIRDDKLRESALAKAAEVRDVLKQVTDTKKSLLPALKDEAEAFRERSGIAQVLAYTGVDILRGRANKATLDYILDGQTQPGQLRAAVQYQDPVEVGLQLSRVLSRYGATSNDLSNKVAEETK